MAVDCGTNLFYSSLGSFLSDEKSSKSDKFREMFSKKYEFSNLFYSSLGPFLSDEKSSKIDNFREHFFDRNGPKLESDSKKFVTSFWNIREK